MAKILLADDNSKYLKDALPFYGHEVITALDGIQTMKVLENNNDIDIVLLDIMMPNMDGWQTLKAIRKKDKNLPVIMLTAVNEDQKMVAGLKNGADDYIVKPFVLPNLLARIDAVLRRSLKHEFFDKKSQVSIAPLTEKENKVIEEAVKELHASIAIPCTACRYCVEFCPMKIDIPKCFALYNDEKQQIAKGFSIRRLYYSNLTKSSGKASACIHCHSCEKHCPQHIAISDWMTKVAETFEA